MKRLLPLLLTAAVLVGVTRTPAVGQAIVRVFGTLSGAPAAVGMVGDALKVSINGGSPSVTSILVGDGTSTVPSIAWTSDADGTGTGLYRSGANEIAFTNNGLPSWSITGGGHLVGQSGRYIRLDSGGALTYLISPGVTGFLELRDSGFGTGAIFGTEAANVLALRNGTNAQIFNIYNTYTNASNYERLKIGYTSNSIDIFSEALGTGSERNLRIGASGGTGTLYLYANGPKWQVGSTGHLITFADNTYDIGASGATRPRTGYFGTSVNIGLVTPAATELDVAGANENVSGIGNIFVRSTDTQAANKGGQISFGGYHIGTASFGDWASVSGRKENSVSGEYGGYLALATRTMGGVTTERWRIDSAGNLVAQSGYYIGGVEQTAPAAPAANGYRLFSQDSGGGKTQLCVIFASGAAQCFATEP